MRVILKENMDNLGKKGDIVVVASGYGRNYLVPKKLAIEITSSNMKMIEMEQQALRKKLEKDVESVQTVIEKLSETTLTFERKAGEKDVIFGSVSLTDIKEALDALGFEIDKKKIVLDEPIKRLGNFSIPIKVFHEHQAEVKVEVLKEGGEAETEMPAPTLVIEKDQKEEEQGEKRETLEGDEDLIVPIEEIKTEEGVIEKEKEKLPPDQDKKESGSDE